MSVLEINKRFPERPDRRDYVVVVAVTPHGEIKELRIKPGSDKATWVLPQWEKDSVGRHKKLAAVHLVAERTNAGCFWLKQAYSEEKFPEGWAQYEKYLASRYDEVIQLEEGGTRTVRRARPVNKGHFPKELLPKRVLKLRAAYDGAIEKGEKWSPEEVVIHPADKAEAARAKAKK